MGGEWQQVNVIPCGRTVSNGSLVIAVSPLCASSMGSSTLRVARTWAMADSDEFLAHKDLTSRAYVE